MDAKTVDYLLREYSNLLTGREQLAYKHLLHDEKLAANSNSTNREKTRLVMLRVGWLSGGEEVLALFRDGILTFRERIAQKIYDAHGGKALLNHCPRCQKLARTSRAKQCRYCGYDWH